MIENKELVKTRKKLTRILTLIISAIIIIIWILFFASKFFITQKLQVNKILDMTNKIQSMKMLSENPIQTLKYMDQNKNSLEKDFDELMKRKESFHFIITDQSNNIEYTSLNSIDLEESNIESIISYSYKKEKRISMVNDFYASKVSIENKYIYVFKKQLYPINDFFTELGIFFWILLLSYIVLYIVAYKFIWYNLKPVERNIQNMEEFVHNAWHELKTPLAVISSQLQLMKEMKSYDWELIQESLEQVNYTNKLIEKLIKLNDINNIENESTALGIVVDNAIRNYKSKFEEKKLKVNSDIDYYVEKFINDEYFNILVSNLISNAIKYSKEWGNISIILTDDYLVVKDDGIWIKKENQEKIFNRFFQEDSSRNQDGFGIWLSLVKKIVDLYKWKIQIRSNEWKGTEVTVQF